MKNDVIIGFHSVNAVLWKTPEAITEIFINKARRDERSSQLIEKATEEGVKLVFVNDERLNKMTNFAKHQGVAAFINSEITKTKNLKLKDILTEDKEESIIVILDSITDPHNLGAIIRSCECFGVDAIIIPANNSANINSTVAKTSAGAIEHIPVITVNNLNTAIKELKDHNYWVYGTTLSSDSTPLYSTNLSSKIVWVLGSEGEGMRRLIAENCDFHVHIPMIGQTQSLNVSVAAGTILSFTNYKLNRK